MKNKALSLCVVLVCALPTAAFAGPVIQFDYTFDTNGFFDPVLYPGRRDVFELAADSVNPFVDKLSEILPSGDNTWSVTFLRPDGGGIAQIVDMSIFPDVIRVFVGSKNFGNGGVLGQAVSTTVNASGDADWVNTVRSRGQDGALLDMAGDFGPWGGVISFNHNPSKIWHDSKTSEGLDTNEVDLFSVAAHELAHVFGFGVSNSFEALVVDGNFTGANAVADGSATNPTLQLNPTHEEWLADTFSETAGASSIALMDPFVRFGERKRITELDLASLVDVGWESALPGDTDRDRDFDSADLFNILRANSYNQGEGFGWSEGDNNGDGYVDSADLFAILATGLFNQGPYASSPSLTSDLLSGHMTVTPEPDSLVLAILGALSLAGLYWRRRRTKAA